MNSKTINVAAMTDDQYDDYWRQIEREYWAEEDERHAAAQAEIDRIEAEPIDEDAPEGDEPASAGI